jgi:sarcosine oxidase subunit delta
MLLVNCPFCGNRPEIEFRCGGEAHLRRPIDPSLLDDEAWAGFLFYRSNTKGVHAERWLHVHGCRQWFNALRNAASDAFIVSYAAGRERPELPPEKIDGATISS